MNKELVLIIGPLGTRSGYGEHARDLIESLIEYDNFDINFSFHCLVNYNSFGPAFGSIMHGCPIIVDKTSLCHPVSNTYKDIEQLKEKDQTEWLLQIAHTEYTVEEIRNGNWYKRLEEYLG